jgi:hypothetical protein
MTVAPANTSSILVVVSGVTQDPSTYSVSGTTLTFSAAPPSGTSNISVRYLGIPASGVTTTAYRTVTDFTATAGQTSFSVPSYTVGYIDVYRNGVRLVSTDYTATTGTTVVLANACTVGDAVVTESFLVSSVLNAIANTAGSVSSSNLAALSTIPSTAGNITVPAVTGTMMVSGNMPAFAVYNSAWSSIANATYTKLAFNTELFDTANAFDSTTNYRFQPTVAGYYQINATITASTSATGGLYIAIYKTNSFYTQGNVLPLNASTGINGVVNQIIYLNGTDYLEIYAYQNSGTSLNVGSNGMNQIFSGALLRAA